MDKGTIVTEVGFFWEELNNKMSKLNIDGKSLNDDFCMSIDKDTNTAFFSFNDKLVAKYTAGGHTVFIDTYGYSNTNIRTKGYILQLNDELKDTSKASILKLIGDIISLSTTIIYYTNNNIDLGELEISESDYSFDSGH